MVVLMDGGTGAASNIGGRQPDPLRKRRNNERHYVFDVAFGADSTQVCLQFDFSLAMIFELYLLILLKTLPIYFLCLGRGVFAYN